MRLNRTTAATCVALIALLYVAATGLAIVVPSDEPNVFGVLWPVPYAAMALIGTLIARRRPENSTGWLFLGGGLLMVVNAFAQAYGQYATAARRAMPAADLIAWFGFWTWMPPTVIIGLVLIVFPTGRPRAPRWRWVVRAGVAVMGVVPVAALFTLGAPAKSMIDASTPADVEGGAFLGFLATGPVTTFLPLGFVAAVIRFIKSRGIERQQMKWFVFGTSILAVGGVAPFFLATEDPISHPIGATTVGLGITAVPVTAGIAILRYRLYDIDRIISRTLAYAIVTVLLAGMFAVVVLVPPAIVGSRARTPDWLIAIGTLAVAAMFRPVRRRVQNTIDHRFNRARYDAAHTIESFAARLRDEVDITTLKADLETVVQQTMHPAHVSLWLKQNAAPG